MDLAKSLSNPWVLGIGVGLGAILLLARGGSGASASGGPDPALVVPSMQIAEQLNVAGMQLTAQQSAMAYAYGEEKLKSDVQTFGIFANLLNSLDENAHVADVQNNAIRAGILQTQIQEHGRFMVAVADAQAKAAQAAQDTMAELYVTKASNYAALMAYRTAKKQANVAKQISQNNMISNIASAGLGTIGNIASAVIGA